MIHEVTKDQLLIEALATIFPNASTNKLRKMLTNNRVEIDGVVVNKAKKEILKGTIIVIRDKKKKPQKDVENKLNIIF